MNRNAPTTKVKNNIDEGLTVQLNNGTILVARYSDGRSYDIYDPLTGDTTYVFVEPCYSITSHRGEMPAFYTVEYATLQELANAMREHCDLRRWEVCREYKCQFRACRA